MGVAQKPRSWPRWVNFTPALVGHFYIGGDIFDQANLLLSAIVDGKTKAECRVLLDRAMEIIAGHFRDEIELIATTPFPDIDHHRRCHQALLGKVVKMSERFDHDELSISELFGFLAHDVIVQHIMDEDRKFFPYLPTPDLEG
ncbi:hemerythrin domain-containing protein [Shewanella oncorhynchi]|uniref:hemerythrin domain-containing protein n=1 Tax=Shewanella oncorhynchi TaxID=2726434 RepID=UPI003D7C0642